MGNDNINYDEEFDRVDESMSAKEEVAEDIFKEPEPIQEPEPTSIPKLDKSQILSKLKIETYTFQEKNGKKIAVKYVPKNSSVIYLNRVVNSDDIQKGNIIVKNPIPKGAEYIKGSATCDSGCTIFYSSGGADKLSKNDSGNIDYIEFYFKSIPANQEVRMGFRAVVKEGG